MPRGVAAAVLLSLALLAGCQKDPIEACVDDAMASWREKPKERWQWDNPRENLKGSMVPSHESFENEADVRHRERLRCMRAASGK